MKILKVDSSTNGASSVSRELTDAVVERLLAQNPGAEVAIRDLGVEPIAHLNPVTTGAIRLPAEDQTPDMKAAASTERAILDEFLSADVVVIGAPMYNFTIPSALKAWMDRLGVPRVTFRYSEKGVEGLAGGRRIIIVSARGGSYKDGAPMEHQTSLLESFFGFIDCDDITVVHANGVGVDRDKAIADGKAVIETL